ncbi:MAG TPA: SIS domain-containing protein [Trebonia sp.]|nr:SIS domain-containing protein [Trebonia sp.]
MNTPPGGVALAAFRLDDPEIVEAGDPGGMLRQVASSAAQVRTALRACAEADLSAIGPQTRPRAIVVAGSGGAGGSAFAGDALTAICGTGAPVQVTTVAGWQLPGWIGAADLVMAVSRSGHTAETLALASEAARRGCDLVAVGAPGSPLAELAVRARGAFIPVTAQGPARAMPWALTVPLLVCAARLGVARLEEASYEAAAAAMEDVSHQCRPSSESFVNPAKSLALDLVGRLPVIWGGSPVAAAAARRFASQLAANAKYPALFGLVAEAGHDQVATFDGPYAPTPEPAFPAAEDLGDPFSDRAFGEEAFGDGDFDFSGDEDLDGTSSDEASLRLVLVADPGGEHPAVERTRVAAASLAGLRGIDVSDIQMDPTGDPLRRLAATTQLLDYASVYLGIANGIDPLAIAAIKDLRDLTGRE